MAVHDWTRVHADDRYDKYDILSVDIICVSIPSFSFNFNLKVCVQYMITITYDLVRLYS